MPRRPTFMAMGRGTGEDQPTSGRRAPARPWRIAAEQVKAIVDGAAPRIAELGEWPDHVDRASLAGRVPVPERTGSGFDAGVACALDLIPRHRQKLSARLHAAYTPPAVAQVRAEAPEMDPDSETCWWAAACSVCVEGRLHVEEFRDQLLAFEALRVDPAARRGAALDEIAAMRSRYELRDGIPFSVEDGGMQGAYVDGHRIAVMHEPDEDIWFIGTFEPSLGLEGFEWGSDIDDLGRPRSGPVHGSRQFVRAGTRSELERALEEVHPSLLPGRPLYHVAPRRLRKMISADGGFWAGDSRDEDEFDAVFVFSSLAEARDLQSRFYPDEDSDIWVLTADPDDLVDLLPDPLERCGWRHEDAFLEPRSLSLLE